MASYNMAVPECLGYECEFIDSVAEDLYCKKCNLVARKCTITSCCGESYCHACIASIQSLEKACLACGNKTYTTFYQMKYQKRISCLHVYCSMKERGCKWSGTLEQLDTHLDPDQDNCQYVDTKCPLHCLMAIPKNKVEQHVALHCTKRPYVCQHCNFKATYEEVVDKHLAECKYVPLQCPNLCGVTFERDFMEDHMRMCRLEEVECEFRGVGCEDRFTREDQEEHVRQNIHKHLTLMAFLAIETKKQLQQNLQEQDKHKEKERKLIEKIQEQEQKIVEQENQIEEQVKKLKKQENKLEELEKEKNINAQHCIEMKECLEAQHKKLQIFQTKLSKVENSLCSRTVTMTEFSRFKRKSAEWYSPAMYTHIGGYKFFLRVCPNGVEAGEGKAVYIQLWSMKGEYDSQLKWPTPDYNITLELVNQHGGRNLTTSRQAVSWNKPSGNSPVTEFGEYRVLSIWYHVVYHYKLSLYLNDDTLCINIDIIQV